MTFKHSPKPFLCALAGETQSVPPIWLMRQAGRYLPEYREVRSQANGFLDLCYSPDKACEVTMQPIRRYGFDAAILFSDILVIPHALQQNVWFVEGEGPKLEPLKSDADLSILKPDAVLGHLQPVFETVSKICANLPMETALIGFAGAPWTVATYMIEGGSSRDFSKTKIWMEEQGESPLRYYTRALTNALAPRFSNQHVIVDWAMRYGTPSIPEKLEELRSQGCEKILIFALYPQYSAATTASVYDKAFDQLKAMRWQPAIRTVPSFHDEPRYIQALADSVREALKDKPDPEMLLCSFHGLPKENLDKGDPYHCFCLKTGRLLREALNWPEDRFGVVFQSRFGPKE